MRRQIRAFQPAKTGQRGAHGIFVKIAVRRMGQHRIKHAIVTDKGGNGARIHPAHANQTALFQPGLQMGLRAIIGRLGDFLTDDKPRRRNRRAGIGGFNVVFIDADIANMGEGEGYNLTSIRRVGQDFLIAGHRRVETYFGGNHTGCAQPIAIKLAPIRRHQQGGFRGRAPSGHYPCRLRSSLFSKNVRWAKNVRQAQKNTPAAGFAEGVTNALSIIGLNL